ncbi:MAG: hypothetical protein ACFBSG_15315 [Leptolyngbyaceae cyanobacterium]
MNASRFVALVWLWLFVPLPAEPTVINLNPHGPAIAVADSSRHRDPSYWRNARTLVAQEQAMPIAEDAQAVSVEAPSVLWLIAMPAVPLFGGVLVYLSRRLRGQTAGECRLVAEIDPPPKCPTEQAEGDADSG